MLQACFFILISCDTDFYGVYYEDNERTILKKAPLNLHKYEIPATTRIIRGGKADSGTFYGCISSLQKLTFAKNSQLIQIEPYGLASLKVSALDLSSCRDLKIIGESSFRFCEFNILKLPPNIQTLKAGAMFAMKNITSIKFPNSLRTLEIYSSPHYGVFGNCSLLSTIELGDNPSLAFIGNDCFKNSGLVNFTIPKQLKIIGGAAFTGCNITKFIIDPENNYFSSDRGILFNKNKTIIYFCSSAMIGNYTIPDTVNLLDHSSFAFTNLKNVIISNSVHTLNYLSFYQSKIISISIPSSVTTISPRIFLECTNLKYIEFNPNINNLEYEMFKGCQNLEQIIIPGGIEFLGDGCFSDCKNIKKIFLPSSVRTIGKSIFAFINESAEIIFESDKYFFKMQNYIYSKDKSKLVAYIGHDIDLEIVIKNTVKVICGSAFAGKNVKSVNFEKTSNCNTIEDSAFEECTGMFSVRIPSSVKSICSSAFKNSEIVKVEFECGLENLSDSAFEGSHITSVELPCSLVTLQSSVFYQCVNLSIVKFLGSNVTSIGDQCFALTGIESIQIPQSIESIGENAFKDSKLSMVTFIQKGTRILGESSFADCAELINIILEPGTEEIKRRAFDECSNLTRITISQTVKKIEIEAFRGCVSLERVTVSSGSVLESIMPLAFEGCLRLSSFEIPSDNIRFKSANGIVTDFDEISVLLHLPGYGERRCEVPSSVKVISEYAFQGAFFMESISLARCRDVEIKFQAFYGCSVLNEVILNGNIQSIAFDAFGNCPSIRCDSIVHDPSIRPLLKASGLSPEIFMPCATEAFTKEAETQASLDLSLFQALYEDNYK